jgi:type II secretory pathway component PulF
VTIDPQPGPPGGDEPSQAPAARSPRWEAGKLSPEDLVTLNEEIAGMARAGLPLDQGLATLAREMGRGRLQKVTSQLADDLRAGLTLPQALQKQQGRVPPFYAALLAAGIRSGRIGDVLGTLTLYARSVADFRDAVTGALVYPAVVLALGLALLMFVGTSVLPSFVDIFDKFKMQLPKLTEVLLFIGSHPIEVVVAPAVILLVVVLLTWRLLRSSQGGRVVWARFVYALPVVGTLIRSARLAAFTDLLGILVDQSIPLADALSLAAAASSDPLLAEAADHITRELGHGVPLAVTLKSKRLVPELVVWMIGFGENQGTLGPALHQLAQMYRRQAETRAALLRVVLPPFLIICLAVFLGGLFIFGIMTPMQGLLEGLSGTKIGFKR